MTLNHSSDYLVPRYLRVFSLTGRSTMVAGVNAGLGAAAVRVLITVQVAGARFLAPLVTEMERRDVEIRLLSSCSGGGLGTATLVPRV